MIYVWAGITLFAMFDEDGRKIEIQEFPRNLDAMSIGEIEEYLIALKAEIKRAEDDIVKKKASRDAAADIFK